MDGKYKSHYKTSSHVVHRVHGFWWDMGMYRTFIPRSKATWGSPVVQYEIATSDYVLLAITYIIYITVTQYRYQCKIVSTFSTEHRVFHPSIYIGKMDGWKISPPPKRVSSKFLSEEVRCGLDMKIARMDSTWTYVPFWLLIERSQMTPYRKKFLVRRLQIQRSTKMPSMGSTWRTSH